MKRGDDIGELTDESIDMTINGIDDITGQKLDKDIIEKAWQHTDFVYDFDEDIIQTFGDSSYDLDFLKEQPDFSDLVDKQFIE